MMNHNIRYKKASCFGLSALMTAMICASLPISSTYASDLDIYRKGADGKTILMLAIDTSSSMTIQDACSGGSCQNITEKKYIYITQCTGFVPIDGARCENQPAKNTWHSYNGDNQGNDSWKYENATGITNATVTGPGWTSYSCNGSQVGYGIYNATCYSLTATPGIKITRAEALKNATQAIFGPSGNLKSDLIVGVSQFSGSGADIRSKITLAAKSLNTTVICPQGNTSKTQRQCIIDVINNLSFSAPTPTVNLLAETISYLRGAFGTSYNPDNVSQKGIDQADAAAKSGSSYIAPSASFTDSEAQCSAQGVFLLTDGGPTRTISSRILPLKDFLGEPNNVSPTEVGADMQPVYYWNKNTTGKGSGDYSGPGNPADGQNISAMSYFNSQGGKGIQNNMNNVSALWVGPASDKYTETTAWQYMGTLAKRAAVASTTATNANAKARQIPIATSILGFGPDWDENLSQTCAGTQDGYISVNNKAMLENDGTQTPKYTYCGPTAGRAYSNGLNVQNARILGALGQGTKYDPRSQTGYYSGSNTPSIINAFNDFVKKVEAKIPAVSTGTATIPTDALYTTQIQKYAYYAQFDPKPGTTNNLWVGNMKKFNIVNGVIKAKNLNDAVVDDEGKLLSVADLWTSTNYAIDSTASVAIQGGMLSRLPIGQAAATGVEQMPSIRKFFSDRTVGTGGVVSTTNNETLTAINTNSYINSADPNKAYLYSLLGYELAPTQFTNPSTITADVLSTTPRFRKAGMILHSRPLLITQGGKISINSTGQLETTNRDDYVLFGSTQGILHVVDATTGLERVAFVPNKMIEKQKEYFKKDVDQSTTSSDFAYGIDGSWTAYTEYVPTSDGELTVGTGKTIGDTNSIKGKQWVYGGLRMGGSDYYALDLADIDTPKLKFHIDPESRKVLHAGSSTDYTQLSRMGQSWSKPTIAWVNWQGKRKLVMFVGGGYDPSYEDSANNPSKSVGNAVYMFDADNGNLLWWTSSDAITRSKLDGDTTTTVQATKNSNLNYSVVSQIKAVDRNNDGLVDHLYFGDLGGQVFRVDINNQNTATSFAKRVVRILNLHDRRVRFYEPPTFTVHNHDTTTFGVVSIGSGNRSQPMFPQKTDSTFQSDSEYENDAVYAIYDKDVARKDLYTIAANSSNNNDDADVAAALLTKNIGIGVAIDSTTLAQTTRSGDRIDFGRGGWYYPFVTDTTTNNYNNRKQVIKVIEEPVAISNDLYVSVYDSSKAGVSGDCGSGVKGETFVHRFCLPYGSCGQSSAQDKFSLGSGLLGISIGPGQGGDSNARSITFLNTNKKDAAQVLGLFEYRTPVKLIAQRWFEKLGTAN